MNELPRKNPPRCLSEMAMKFLNKTIPTHSELFWSLILKMTVKTSSFLGEADHRKASGRKYCEKEGIIYQNMRRL